MCGVDDGYLTQHPKVWLQYQSWGLLSSLYPGSLTQREQDLLFSESGSKFKLGFSGFRRAACKKRDRDEESSVVITSSRPLEWKVPAV